MTKSKTPRERAAACFAVARSTTFPAERDAAVGRGMGICEAHGLDPDAFDIPGRQRAAKVPPPGQGAFEFTADSVHVRGYRAVNMAAFSDPAFAEAMRNFGETIMRERRAAAMRAVRGLRRCPGCNRPIMFGDSCVECARSGRV